MVRNLWITAGRMSLANGGCAAKSRIAKPAHHIIFPEALDALKQTCIELIQTSTIGQQCVFPIAHLCRHGFDGPLRVNVVDVDVSTDAFLRVEVLVEMGHKSEFETRAPLWCGDEAASQRATIGNRQICAQSERLKDGQRTRADGSTTGTSTSPCRRDAGHVPGPASILRVAASQPVRRVPDCRTLRPLTCCHGSGLCGAGQNRGTIDRADEPLCGHSHEGPAAILRG